jgi:hypothetical protein
LEKIRLLIQTRRIERKPTRGAEVGHDALDALAVEIRAANLPWRPGDRLEVLDESGLDEATDGRVADAAVSRCRL